MVDFFAYWQLVSGMWTFVLKQKMVISSSCVYPSPPCERWPRMPQPPQTPVEMLVCKTCKRADIPATDMPPGEQLFQKLTAADLPTDLSITAVECLSNCRNGCTVILRSEQRWTYIYGNINPESDFEQLCRGIEGYVNSENGIVPWKERVALFKKNCVARIPPAMTQDQEAD